MKRRTIIIFILVSALALLFWVLQNNQIKSLGQASRAGTPAALKKTNDIISERYHVKRGSKRLYGVITAPRGYKREKLPLVIISHGFNNTLEMYEEYANHLARMGYIVYWFDFYGGSTDSKSGGTNMLNMSILTEKRDLSAV